MTDTTSRSPALVQLDDERRAARTRFTELVKADRTLIADAGKACDLYHKLAGKRHDKPITPAAADAERKMLRAVARMEANGVALARERTKLELLEDPAEEQRRLDEANRAPNERSNNRRSNMNATTTKKVTWREKIEAVLSKANKPMSLPAIMEALPKDTNYGTVAWQLGHFSKGNDAPFVKTGRAEYAIAGVKATPQQAAARAAVKPKKTPAANKVASSKRSTAKRAPRSGSTGTGTSPKRSTAKRSTAKRGTASAATARRGSTKRGTARRK